MAVTPFQLIEPFSMDSFNSRISEINTMFGGLGNEYVWAKTVVTNNYGYKESTNELAMSLEGSDGTITVHYGDTYSVNTDLTVTIPNEQTYTMAYGSDPSVMNVLKGKWWWSTQYGNSIVYYLPSDATITRSYVAESCYYYTSVKQTERRDFYVIPVSTTVGYVNSPDQNAYPPAVSDGYTYTPLGKVAESMRAEAGTYVGTGGYREGNGPHLIFNIKPKLIILTVTEISNNYTYAYYPQVINFEASKYASYEAIKNYGGYNYLRLSTFGFGEIQDSPGIWYGEIITDNEIKWFMQNGDEISAYNKSGKTYHYLAIG